MKRRISLVLSAAVLVSLFAGCASESTDPAQETVQSGTEAAAAAVPEYKTTHTLYFKDSTKSGKAAATFFNSDSGKSEEVEMKKVGESDDSVTFSCEGNCAEYNTVSIKHGDATTQKLAFNPCVSGWYQSDKEVLPYTEGKETTYEPDFEEITLTCIDYDKPVYIWKPDDYDPTSSEKYSTIYLLDGQFIMYTGKYGQVREDCTDAIEQIDAMISSTGQKAIVVAVDNVGKRDFELVPNIGVPMDKTDFEYEGTDGTKFAEFVGKTLVPYIQEHYNVCTDALHTSLAGVSLGGMESFYIAQEYPEIFDTVGSFSPSFWEYDDETWSEYLSGKTFGGDSPFVYFYTGPKEFDTDPHVTDMYNRLKKLGYPESRLVLHFNEDGAHGGVYWRAVFSEFLAAMIYQRVEPLQK